MSQVHPLKKNHVIAILVTLVYRKFRYQADKYINPKGYTKIHIRRNLFNEIDSSNGVQFVA